MELLAPAGSMAALRSAVLAGADAVYLGGKSFNARQSAANFSLDELAEAVNFAHQYNVKIYVTVNTLTHDTEMDDLAPFLCELAKRQVDAFIVQDLGVARLAHHLVPQVELHASTQMTIHNREAFPLLSELGFKRVVLAREVNLAEIKAMHQAYPQIGLEVFAHGALCYAYSGQCLLSSMLGGRSGNRGACAQPCRLPYTLYHEDKPVKTAGNYLMSPKDLCLIEHLPSLRAAGAVAIKIEGRLKRPEYVYTVVQLYRRALDQASFHLDDKNAARLLQAFNRGFTQGHIIGAKGSDFMSYGQPDNRGVPIGKVERVYKQQARVRLTTALAKGDVLAWRNQQQSKTYHVTTEMQPGALLILKDQPLPSEGSLIHRVVSTDLWRQVQEAQRKPQGKFGLDIRVYLQEGKPLVVQATDQTGLQATVYSHELAEHAQKRPLDEKTLQKQLGKLGGTPYFLASLQAEIVGAPIFPYAVLNDCRRRLVEALTKKRLSDPIAIDIPACEEAGRNMLLESQQIQPGKQVKPQLVVTVKDLAEAEAALQQGADMIYWGGTEAISKPDDALQVALKYFADKIVWRLPRISKDEEMEALTKSYQKLKEAGLRAVLVDNLGQLGWFKNEDLKLGINTGIPVFNRQTVKVLQQYGVAWQTLSPELNTAEISDLVRNIDGEFEVIIHGALLLMIHEHSILHAISDAKGQDARQGQFTLRDRKDYHFRITQDDHARSYLYNSQDIVMIDEITTLIKLPFKRLRLETAGRGSHYVSVVTSLYRQALDAAYNDKVIDREKAMQALRLLSPQGVTRGHFHRGV